MYKKIKLLINEGFIIFRFKFSAANSWIFIAYYKYLFKPKKGSLDSFLNEYSLSKKNSLNVVQIGANDGITNDPIHKFIKRDNWRGVLLEPQSYIYENFLKKIYHKNEGIHTLCAAIGEKDDKQYLYKIGFCDMRWATGLASFLKENVENAFSSGLVERKCSKYNIKIPSPSEQITSEEVMVISPETLIKKYNISTIDLLQIDVEGYDFEVIKIFKIQKSKPKAIIFEHINLSEQDMELCVALLEENNYAVRKFDANTLAMLYPLGEFEKYFGAVK
jgi:FkbM family methyltransferase